MSAQEYPSEEQLIAIQKWNADDFHGLMAYVKSLWAFDAWGWNQEGEIYKISTGGWSGNEDLICALQSNFIWWMMYWQSSTRGGHYVFAPLSVILKNQGIETKE